MKALAENLWLLTYPLKLLGVDMRRNVTVIRLASGQVIVHSTAPFGPADITKIRGLGPTGWLVEAMRFHDTFSGHGHDIFPGVPFLAPTGFSEVVGFPTEPLLPAPAAWGDEVQVIHVSGNESYDEHVIFHRPSRTLVVADLAFNFPDDEPLWAELLVRAAVGRDHHPGMSRPFRHAVGDEPAFRRSMDAMMEWDFDRVIVGHGDVIETGGKEKLALMLANAGL
jgi:hypothetical protein